MNIKSTSRGVSIDSSTDRVTIATSLGDIDIKSHSGAANRSGKMTKEWPAGKSFNRWPSFLGVFLRFPIRMEGGMAPGLTGRGLSVIRPLSKGNDIEPRRGLFYRAGENAGGIF